MARKKQASSSNPDALEALAALGRKTRERAERNRRQTKNAERDAAERRSQRQVRATLGQASGLFLLIIGVVVLVPSGVIWAAYSWTDPASATWITACTLVSAILLYVFGLRWLGVRRLAEEQAYLASLPFSVDGYFDVIGESPSGSCTVSFELCFRGAALEKSTARDVGAVIDAELDGIDARIARFIGPDLDCSVNDGDDTNGPVLSFMRRALREVALPLHEGHPLDKVSFRRR